MAQCSAPVSTRRSWCFDTVWRQNSRAKRRKQDSLIFSNLSRNLRWGKCDSSRLGLLQCFVICGGVGVGGYWSLCGHLWHLSGELSVWERGSEGTVEWFYVCTCDTAGRQTIARQTGSLKVHPVSLHVSHKQLVFVSLGPLSVYFSFSPYGALPCFLPLAAQNTES